MAVLSLAWLAAVGFSETVEVLVVAGGGGGGGGGETGGPSGAYGGGGAGGVRHDTAYALGTGVGIAVIVGSGGAHDANGGDSSFGTFSALGGGAGGKTIAVPGNGGSGGGGNYLNGGYYNGSYHGSPGTGAAGQGYGGGWGYTDGVSYGVGGGGGGAGGIGGGQITSGNPAGDGGIGVAYSITGTSVYYGGGGGGGGDHRQSYATGGSGGLGGGGSGATSSGGTGAAGTANTGGGGGGGGYNGTGGAGGSGVVIIRYAGLPRATGGTITQSGGYTIHAFTTSGTFLPDADETLPYTTGFEVSEGYIAGSLNAQGGWTLLQGAADVSDAEHSAGTRGLILQSGANPAIVALAFADTNAPNITYLDLDARPVAAANALGSSLIQTPVAKVGFKIAGTLGEVHGFDGVGANQWVASGHRFALNSSNRASDWLRLTLRLDYLAKKWDLYADGLLVEYDLAFTDNSETYFRQLSLYGVTTAPSHLDSIYVGGANPLFTDADNDGMEDAWESTSGLSTSADDRNGNLDGDAYTNIEEYYAGTKPNNADVTQPGQPTSLINANQSQTTIDLTWTGSTDTGAGTPGIAGYNIYRNGVKVNASPVTTTTYQDTGLTALTNYSYTVCAVDLAGNVSDPSAAFSVSTQGYSTTGTFEVFTPLQ